MSPTPPDDPAGPVRSTGPRRSRRRRRRGGQRATPPAPPLVPTVSGLAEPGPASDVLAPPEIAEMKEHLSFLRRYKEALRLKLNHPLAAYVKAKVLMSEKKTDLAIAVLSTAVADNPDEPKSLKLLARGQFFHGKLIEGCA